MKKLALVFVILLVIFGIYWISSKSGKMDTGKKMEALKAKKHSNSFNNNVDTMMNAYFELKAAFVEADSIRAKTSAKNLLLIVDSIPLTELKKDTAGIFESADMQMGDIKANIESLVKQTSLIEMRQDFRMVSESIYPLLKTIHYEGKTLYWQNCPMAFGEGKEANWISNTEEIVNPFLGKHDAEFKSAMLHCGENKDSIKSK